MSLADHKESAYAYKVFMQMPNEPTDQKGESVRNYKVQFWAWLAAYANRKLVTIALRPRPARFYRFKTRMRAERFGLSAAKSAVGE